MIYIAVLEATINIRYALPYMQTALYASLCYGTGLITDLGFLKVYFTHGVCYSYQAWPAEVQALLSHHKCHTTMLTQEFSTHDHVHD